MYRNIKLESAHKQFSGEALKWRYEAAGIRECDLARELRIPLSLVRAWEKGEERPTLQQLGELIFLLSCKPIQLTVHGFTDKARLDNTFMPQERELDAPRKIDFCACGAVAMFCCDKVLAGGKVCSVPLCADCAREVGPDQHLCREHAYTKGQK